ncbi:T9SS type A sorting domain-containing protein [Ferruginibacter lapsinanis]|uniref:T9SS type A sorting domain-containing protein n=1 Tax=Ferruginibacter lapsinanis TaxID=563172 RepID=UPI001E607806|nr:T9SS type A sorting domain-containing protein [Ferruginibacter lapsinanis]UEG49277.1 T9SS type A sorting domain-containing protein [Ferruginibacter lapsinanis]
MVIFLLILFFLSVSIIIFSYKSFLYRSVTPAINKKYFHKVKNVSGVTLGLILLFSTINAQELKLTSGIHMVMNGSINLVLNNTGFNNNGVFTADVSTVKFSGTTDTTVSYVKGSSGSTFYNLTTDKSAYGLAVKSYAGIRNVLKVGAGHLYCDSNLTLLSDATLTARVDNVPASSEIYGKAFVQRYMPPRRAWRLLTAPVTSSNTILNTWQNGGVYEAGKGTWVTGPNPGGPSGNGIDDSPEDNVSMKGFNYSTQAFTNVLNTKVPISSGSNGSADNTGYFIFVRGDRVYNNFDYYSGACTITTLTSVGKLQTHTQTFTTAKDSAKYTLIGNPYASPINFNNVTRNNIVKRFFVLDPSIGSVGSWVMLDDLDGDGTYTKSIAASSMTNEIQSGQAVMVVTNGNVPSASITFEETSKATSTNTTIMGRPASPSSPIASIRGNFYLLNPDNAIIADGNLTEFDNRYSAATNLEDASKPSNTNENFTLIRNGLSFSVERRPMLNVHDTIFFKTWRTTQRNYRIELVPSYLAQTGLQGFLEDSYLKTSTPVSLETPTVYDFSINSAPASQAMDRFRVVFRPIVVSGPLPVTISNIKASLQTDNNIAVEWIVENETNIAKYEVEKSADGASFITAGTKNVAGNNNSTNTYNWLDEHTLTGNNFYRIKIYETNGQVKYSSIVKVSNSNNIEKGLNVYPNPVTNGTINLHLNNQVAGSYELKLINTLGQIIYNNTLKHTGSNATYVIKLKESQLINGIYQLKITTPDKTIVTQSIIAK